MDFFSYLIKKAHDDGIEKIVVGGVIMDSSGKVLILKRKQDDFMGGICELPSGNMEKNETIEESLKREIKEETNLDVKKIKYYINSFDYLSSSGKKARQYNFLVEVFDGDILLTEHDEYIFMSIDGIRESSNISREVKDTLEIAFFNA